MVPRYPRLRLLIFFIPQSSGSSTVMIRKPARIFGKTAHSTNKQTNKLRTNPQFVLSREKTDAPLDFQHVWEEQVVLIEQSQHLVLGVVTSLEELLCPF